MKKQKLLDCQNRDEYEKGLAILSDLFAKGIKGNTEKDIKDAIIQLRRRTKISNGFNELYEWLKHKEFNLVLMSSSPVECIDIIKQYKFDYYIAFETCKKNGVYVGSHKGAMTPSRKIQKLRPILSNHSFYFGVGNYWDMDVFKNSNKRFLIGDDYDGNSMIKINNLLDILEELENI